ncbi:hypothetical protein [Streptomyces axinellae]|uniref:MmyB-like transcription regulator ligand binding domain-containing protein n=1 Tax=Streptomyces axinellae TaxID=552788 RepID=A0ABN3QRX0_9ACTN
MPALLVNRWLDIVDSNTLGDGPHEGLEPRDNYARLVFPAPGAQAFCTEWPQLARCMARPCAHRPAPKRSRRDRPASRGWWKN